MIETCKGDWRCRRICKVGRASARNRPPHCPRQAYGAHCERARRKSEGSPAAQLSLAVDEPMRLAAE